MKRKQLKQSSLFEKLKKNKISISAYVVIHKLYTFETVDPKHLYKIDGSLFDVTVDGPVLTEKALSILKDIETLFYGKKKATIVDLMGADYIDKLTEYNELFPRAKVENRYMRCNIKDLERNFLWFFTEYECYTWEQVMKATEKYIREITVKGPKYMRNSKYFIRKLDQNNIIACDLATWCEVIKNPESYREEKVFSAKILGKR